jgi:hypothetical protein
LRFEELADESPATTAGFLERAVAFYAGHAIRVERVLSDNGGGDRSKLFAANVERLRIGLPRSGATGHKGTARPSAYPHHAERVGLRQALPRHRRPGSQSAGPCRSPQSISTALVTRRPAANETGSVNKLTGKNT